MEEKGGAGMSGGTASPTPGDYKGVAGTAAPLHPVRILIATVADLPEGGGHTSRLKTLAGCLVRQGHSVRIWSKHVMGQFPPEMLAVRGQVEGADYEIIRGATTRTWGVRSLFMKMRATALMAIRLWRERHDVDVLWLNELSFHDMLPLMMLARLAGIPVVLSYEDEHLALCAGATLALRQRLFTGWDDRLADRLLVRRAEAVVVICTYLQEKYAALGARNLTLVPTIVDVAPWRGEPRPSDGRLRFFYAGSLYGTYVLKEILVAMGGLRAEGFDFEFQVFGDVDKGPLMPELLQLRQEAGLQDRVRFSRSLPLLELRREIHGADVLLCIREDTQRSRSGLSTKLSECLASGRATIASRVGDVPRYLTDGVNALIVPSTSVEDIQNTLRQCLKDRARLQVIGNAGREVAERHFSYEVTGAILNNLLRRVRPGRPAASPG